jgi:hypothetical protein
MAFLPFRECKLRFVHSDRDFAFKIKRPEPRDRGGKVE